MYLGHTITVLKHGHELQSELPFDKLESMIVDAKLEDLPKLGKDILKGQVQGRVVVDVNA